jgi:preprotein translocase subunit SecF
MRLLKLIPDNTNLDFLRWRGVAITISTLLIAASIALIAIKGLNFGVDFAGGQMIRVSFTQAPQLDDLRQRVGELGLGEPSIQEFGSPRKSLSACRFRKAARKAPMPRPRASAKHWSSVIPALALTLSKRFPERCRES